MPTLLNGYSSALPTQATLLTSLPTLLKYYPAEIDLTAGEPQFKRRRYPAELPCWRQDPFPCLSDPFGPKVFSCRSLRAGDDIRAKDAAYPAEPRRLLAIGTPRRMEGWSLGGAGSQPGFSLIPAPTLPPGPPPVSPLGRLAPL